MNAAANMLRSVLNTSRAALSSGIPKRPPTSYMLFAKAQRAAGAVDASLKVPEQGKQIGAAWRALSESAKSPYEAESLRLREAYAAEVKAYTETHGAPPPSKKALKQSQPKKKRAPSAYVLFVSDVLKNETAPKQVDRMRAVAAKWGSMSDAEKAPYQRRAAEAKAAMS